MAVGVWLHVTEHHEDEHSHESRAWNTRIPHIYDAHHQHGHDPNDPRLVSRSPMHTVTHDRNTPTHTCRICTIRMNTGNEKPELLHYRALRPTAELRNLQTEAEARAPHRCAHRHHIIQDPAHLEVPPRCSLQPLCSSETDRQSNEWIDPICRRRHANVHSSIQLGVFGQLIGEACSEHDRIAS